MNRTLLAPYGEPLSDARTPLADVFRFLLGSAMPEGRHIKRTLS